MVYASYGYPVLMMVPCFWLFYVTFMLLMIIIYTFFPLADGEDRTAVGYFCIREGTSSGSKFLHLFKSCYHVVGRSSEVSISRFSDIKMENIKDNNGCYNVAIQVIDRDKTIIYQELCIYPDREFIL